MTTDVPRRVSRPRTGWVPVGLALLAAAAYCPLLLIEASELWRRPHYQFFPLVLLGSAYLALASRDQGQVTVWHFLPHRAARDQEPTPERRLVLSGQDPFGDRPVRVRWWDREKKALGPEEQVNPRKGVIGLGLAVRAPAAYARLAPESGLHVFHSARTPGNNAFPMHAHPCRPAQ